MIFDLTTKQYTTIVPKLNLRLCSKTNSNRLTGRIFSISFIHSKSYPNILHTFVRTQTRIHFIYMLLLVSLSFSPHSNAGKMFGVRLSFSLFSPLPMYECRHTNTLTALIHVYVDCIRATSRPVVTVSWDLYSAFGYRHRV